jgi:hypothetical protein
MKNIPIILRKIKNAISLQSHASTLDKEDVLSHHRMGYYKILVFFLLVVYTSVIFQYPIHFWRVKELFYVTHFLFISSFINYIVLNYRHNSRFAYRSLIISLFLILHIFSYFLGGIRHSGVMYYICIIFYTYSLIGKKEGKCAAALGVIHCIYFQFVASHFFTIDYSLANNDASLIDLDYFVTAIAAVIIAQGHANAVERTQNDIVAAILNTKDQLAEMEIQSLRAQMNPHFTFNVMNSIQYYLTHNDSESANKYLGKFSLLMRKILDNSQTTFITLQDELIALKIYLELEKMRFEESFDYVFIEAENLKPESMMVPSMILQPFVENSIKHGFATTKVKGLIEIRLDYNNGILTCTISDNGVGLSASNQKKPTGHKSVGIKITTERIRKINSIYKSNASIDIMNGDVSGTKVVIRLPNVN